MRVYYISLYLDPVHTGMTGMRSSACGHAPWVVRLMHASRGITTSFASFGVIVQTFSSLEVPHA